MRLICYGFLLVIGFAAGSLRGQSSVPTLRASLPGQALAPGGPAVTIDVRNYFFLPGVGGERVAQVNTVVGTFNIELLENDAPRNVANFLNYISAGRYQNTFIHRVVPGFVMQAGGYTATVPFTHIATFDPVQNEFKVPNIRGTVAMAKQGGNPNSATSEWFVNLADNRANLDNQNGGFTVFGRVIGTGMNVVDAIAALPRANIGLDPEGAAITPVRNVPPGETQMRPEYYVTVTDIKAATLFPTGGGPSVLSVSSQVSTPGIIETLLSGSTLTMTPIAPGSTNVTVRVVDTNGNAAESTFTVSVAGALNTSVLTAAAFCDVGGAR
jgi:cyclophilin family peptidyl-prolyl cis-trans isomerase